MKSYDCRTAVQTIAHSEPNATILNVAKWNAPPCHSKPAFISIFTKSHVIKQMHKHVSVTTTWSKIWRTVLSCMRYLSFRGINIHHTWRLCWPTLCTEWEHLLSLPYVYLPPVRGISHICTLFNRATNYFMHVSRPICHFIAAINYNARITRHDGTWSVEDIRRRFRGFWNLHGMIWIYEDRMNRFQTIFPVKWECPKGKRTQPRWKSNVQEIVNTRIFIWRCHGLFSLERWSPGTPWEVVVAQRVPVLRIQSANQHR